MTQRQLEAAVATATGESLGVVRSLGFGLVASSTDGMEAEDVDLVIDCPTCGRPVDFPGRAADGSLALAECHRCDAYFPVDDGDTHLAGT